MGETINPVQVGLPRSIRLSHVFANAQMFMVAGDQPLPYHYWMIDRIAVTLNAPALVSGVPPTFCLFQTVPGVYETPAGALAGNTSLNSSSFPQGDSMVLLDSGQWTVNGTTLISPYLIADESHPCLVPENRVLVAYITGYNTVGATGYVQVEITYSDWILDRDPRVSVIPATVETVSAEQG
jgi:hypothetical protein